jgi:hypothetical protein
VPFGVGDPGVDHAGKAGGIATRFHSCRRRVLLLGVSGALALLTLVKSIAPDSMMVLSRSTCSRHNRAVRQGEQAVGNATAGSWAVTTRVASTVATQNLQPTELCGRTSSSS